MNEHTARLEELRAILRSESISYGELAELQYLVPYIEPGDVELLEPAGVPEEIAHDGPAIARWLASQEHPERELTPQAEIEAVVGAAVEMFESEVEQEFRDESDSTAADLAAVVVYQLARDYDLDLAAMADHVTFGGA